MARRSCSLLFLLFAILRVFGAFPYRWRYLPDGLLEVKRSVLAIIWSWLLVLGMTSMSLSCVVNSPDFQNGTTLTISTHILNYMTYLTSAVFFPYLALRSHKLAHILHMMSDTHIPMRRPILGQEDYMQILCMMGILIGLSYATIRSLSDMLTDPTTREHLVYDIPATSCDFVIETTTVTLGLLLYFIIKILSLESEAAVAHLDPASDPRKQDKNSPVNKSEVLKRPGNQRLTGMFESKERPTAAPGLKIISITPRESTADSCYRVSRLLLELDDIVMEVVEYTGPAAAMILLTSTVNATIMLYQTITKLSDYYVAYITLKTLSAVQVTFIPDCLWCKREESLRLVRRLLATKATSVHMESGLRDVEKILSTSTKFLVCRLFTLDRHIILSVASSVVTYLVIALQFSFSELRHSAQDNCTVVQYEE